MRALALAGAALPLLAAPGGAQSVAAGEAGWNGPAALELVARARDARQQRHVDSTFRSYAAQARGHVYFLIDRPDEKERTLVKADQVALEVYWQAPDLTRQRIVGLRDEKVLPTNIHYHLDHLTVVQDEFEDRIRLGDGDEVSDVVHPVAPGAEGVYDYRLADSLTLTFGGSRPDVRVYEVLVRPRDMDRPGFVGSVFLDRASAAIVRMSFTFTPASYVDPYLDYIRISLDNSLWEGRHWLPYRQEAEIRRELPQLDFMAGSIIRGRFEIGEYVFNPPLPPALFGGVAVTAVPSAQREAFPFEDPLLPDDEAERFGPPPSLEDVRATARQVAGRRALSGLRRFRLHVSSASQVFRYDRAEGAFIGLGVGWRPDAATYLTATGGWAFGRDEPSVVATLGVGGPLRGTSASVAFNDLRDLGPFPGASGVINTLATLARDHDHLDPYFAHGVAVRHDLPGLPLRLEGRLERHEAARDVVEGRGSGDGPGASGRRGLRRVEEGVSLTGGATLSLPVGADATLVARGTGGRFRLEEPFQERALDEARLWGAATGTLAWSRAGAARALDLRASLDGGLASSGAPAQGLFLLGGRETLLGHPYRGLVGDRFWLARASADRTLMEPWLSVRAFAATGQALLASHPLDAAAWLADPDGGVKASVGAGVGLAWDLLHVDVGRGLGDGGGWATALSVDRRFRGWL